MNSTANEVNGHVEGYLKSYFASDNPGFAVLLQGEWGCGKTHFIKKFQHNYQGNIAYISLFDVTSLSDINMQLWLSSSASLKKIIDVLPMRAIMEALSTVTDLLPYGKILNRIKPQMIEEVVKKNAEERAKLNPYALIFDDLERCRLPLKEIFGYINTYIEHYKSKVVILTNEDEIKDIEYTKIKEKLIGKTFRVEHDVEAAFDAFIQQLSDDKTGNEVKEFLAKRKTRIIELFNTAGYYNLRHLKQSLFDFNRLYSEIPGIFYPEQDLIEHVLMIFLAFSFDIKAAKIKPHDIETIYEAYVEKTVNARRTEKREPKQFPIYHTLNTYSFIDPEISMRDPDTFMQDPYYLILSEEYWAELFDKGSLESEKLGESFKNSRFCRDKYLPAWIRLWHLYSLEDDEFSSLVKKFRVEWNNHKFTQPEEILHVSGILFRLSKEGLYDKDVQGVLIECKEYIDSLKAKGIWRDSKKRWDGLFFDYQDWEGRVYHERELPEFEALRTYLQTAIEESISDNRPEAARQLLNLLHKEPQKFWRMVKWSNSAGENYAEEPILQHIEPEEFLTALLKIKNQDKQYIYWSIEGRYKDNPSSTKLLDEIPFLEKLDSLLTEESKKLPQSITGVHLQGWQQRIRGAIIHLKEFDHKESMSDDFRE